LSGDTLFVANDTTDTVGECNASTGAAINAKFITGPNPVGLALSGKTLFVAFANTDTVGEYNVGTGAAINAKFITDTQDGETLAVASVPEPSIWSMIAGGGAALLGILQLKRYRTCRSVLKS
jgi:hypothetical protein